MRGVNKRAFSVVSICSAKAHLVKTKSFANVNRLTNSSFRFVYLILPITPLLQVDVCMCEGFKSTRPVCVCVCDLDLYKLRGSFTLEYYTSLQSQPLSTRFFRRLKTSRGRDRSRSSKANNFSP